MKRSFTRWQAPALLFLVLLGSPAPRAGSPLVEQEGLGPGPLPLPPRAGGPSLVETLWKRRSTRRFAPRSVKREDLAYLLWAAGGINRPEEKKRTSPSAWDAYSVTIYVSSPSGTAVYDPESHALKPAGAAASKDLRREIPRAESTQAAPLILILVADFSRFPEKASERSRPFMAHGESGAMAENVYLAAAALGLGTVLTADARPESKELLGLGKDQMALYVIPVGYPAEGEGTGG